MKRIQVCRLGGETMFVYDDNIQAYVCEMGGVRLCCKAITEKNAEKARALTVVYQQKLEELLSYLLPDLSEVYGYMDSYQLRGRLGTPVIDLDGSMILYLEASFDHHIITVEYTGDMDRFTYISIDG